MVSSSLTLCTVTWASLLRLVFGEKFFEFSNWAVVSPRVSERTKLDAEAWFKFWRSITLFLDSERMSASFWNWFG
jgi:hypothetical protein